MTEPFPNTRCAMCDSEFECGILAGKDSCWCKELPPMKVEGAPADKCLCFTCLQKYGEPPAKNT